MMKNEIQGAEILKLEVPTVFGKAGEVLKKRWSNTDPTRWCA